MAGASFNLFRPHPWHGLLPGSDPPNLLQAYIEITPFDSVKYEMDKPTGYLRVDRPQRWSSLPPTVYGFVPQTYSGPQVAALTEQGMNGDEDPLDICVISERPINHTDILVDARVVGGLVMIDQGKVDDKIIAVFQHDDYWGDARDIGDIPESLVERLQHYFLTYKLAPGRPPPTIVPEIYGVERARQVVQAAMRDYIAVFRAGSSGRV